MHERFREGDFMSWQEMTKLLKEYDDQISFVLGYLEGLANRNASLEQKFVEHETLLKSIIAEVNDIQTRLDDVESAMGDVFQAFQEGEYRPDVLPTGEEEDEGDYPSDI